MKKINRKAFTLIEILATVTILGVLSVVAMVSVNSIIKNAKEKHYTNAEDQMELAGQSYVQQHRNKLPKSIGQKVKIPMKELVNTNYIEQIKDYSDNGCDMEKSYVQIFKYSQDDYSYLAYLHCPVYQSTEHLKEAAPNIVLTIKGDTMGSGDKKGETQELKIQVNPEGDEKTLEKPSKLISYSYIIHKHDKEVKNSGSVALPNYNTRLNKTVDLTPYTPGKLKITVTATNIYGLTTTKTITTDYKDTTGPECIIKEIDLPENPKEWQKNPVKITVGCKDENGSGCTREEYTKTFKNTAITDFITIEDNEGNKTQCEVSVNIDITPPTVPEITMAKWSNNLTMATTAFGLIAYENNTWTNHNIITEATSVDANCGLKEIQYTLSGKEGTEINTVASKRNITAEGTTKIKYRACDNLDNCSEYTEEKIIRIDKTAPDMPTITLYKWKDNSTQPNVIKGLTEYTSGTWSNRNIIVVPKSPQEGDDTSKIKEYQYTTGGETENSTNKAALTRNIKAEGDSTIKYRTCDNAGNCSIYSDEYTIKLDKTNPIVTITTPSTSENNNTGVTVESTCTDERSGVASHTSSSNTGSPYCGNVTHSCTDNAGNVGTDSESYTIKYYSANSACGVESYNTCAHSECGSYCAYWGCYGSNGGVNYMTSDKSGTQTCSGGGGVSCAIERNYSCATAGCGVKSYYSCWHC